MNSATNQKSSSAQTKIVALPQQSTIAQSPYSQESEEALLGSILINPKIYAKIADILNPDDFFFLRHQYVFAAMGRLHERETPLDLVTVTTELAAHKQLDEVGGPVFITQLIRKVPTSVHAEVYAGMVKRTQERRALLELADTYQALARDETKTTEEVFSTAYQGLMDVMESHNKAQWTSINDGMATLMDRMWNGETITGVPSKIKQLDDMIGGFHKGKFIVVGGSSHHGKTAFMIQAALDAAKSGARVGYFNIADGDEMDIYARMVALETGILPNVILYNQFKDDAQRGLATEAFSRLSELPIHVHSEKGVTPRQIWMKAQNLKNTGGLDIIFIDYLQRMSGGEKDKDGDYSALKYCSMQMPRLALRLDIPVVVGAQLNKARGNDEPEMRHIEGGGVVFQDADVVLLMYKKSVDYGDELPELDDPDEVKIICAKNKVTGQKGYVVTKQNPVSTRFSEQYQQRVNLGG